MSWNYDRNFSTIKSIIVFLIFVQVFLFHYFNTVEHVRVRLHPNVMSIVDKPVKYEGKSLKQHRDRFDISILSSQSMLRPRFALTALRRYCAWKNIKKKGNKIPCIDSTFLNDQQFRKEEACFSMITRLTNQDLISLRKFDFAQSRKEQGREEVLLKVMLTASRRIKILWQK